MSMIQALIDQTLTLENAIIQANQNDQILGELLTGILSKEEDIRYTSYEVLQLLAVTNPKRLYPQWDALANLLNRVNHYQRYIAINLLALLAPVDSENKFVTIFDRYFNNIKGDRTMVAGQAALNVGKIARAKSELQSQVTSILLKIDQLHQSKQIELIKAYAIEAFSDYFEVAIEPEKIVEFVKLQLTSSSPKTRKIAHKFLERWI